MKCLLDSWKFSCYFLQFFQNLVFVQLTIWLNPSFRTTFVRRLHWNFPIILAAEVASVAVFCTRVYRKSQKTSKYFFGWHNFFLGYVTVDINKVSVKYFEQFNLLTFKYLELVWSLTFSSFPMSIGSLFSHRYDSVLVHQIEMKIQYCSCCCPRRRSKNCGCVKISVEPNFHSLVLKVYASLVFQLIWLTNNHVKTNTRLFVIYTCNFNFSLDLIGVQNFLEERLKLNFILKFLRF